MPRRPKKTRKRYTAARKVKILAAAKSLGLTGAQVARRFGVAQLTFYRWRGPVRGRRGDPARIGRRVRTGVR